MSGATIKAIETHYKGYRFRSRLEARWAVFFDALGIAYEYEPEGFEVPFEDGNIRYLPDFRLPGLNLWVEVKGSKEQFDKDARRIAWMVDFGHLPGVSDGGGLLILGSIPDTSNLVGGKRWVMHPVLRHEKGVVLDFYGFGPQGKGLFWYDSTEVTSAPDLPDFDYLNTWLLKPPDGEGQHISAFDAYRAARSARFEHGERG